MEERPGVTSKVILPDESADILKCMSTNGLLLYEKADEIIDIGIDSLTVTVNAVDPEIEAKLNDYIIYYGKKYEGVEDAAILIENQLKGIRKIAGAGITIKVNSVLVPGKSEFGNQIYLKRVASKETFSHG